MWYPILVLVCVIVSSTCVAQTPDWSLVTTRNSPAARWSHGMAYDSVRKRTVLFAGSTGVAAFQDDTWEYDGTNWTRIAAQPPAWPSVRRLTTMAYHLGTQKTLMFGGVFKRNSTPVYRGDTWTWDGVRWAQVGYANRHSPSPRAAAAMAYDSIRDRTVLFGGTHGGGLNVLLNDTWEWDGARWTRVLTANAPSLRNTSIAFDSVRGRIVLYGGSSNRGALGDTWEYDGRDWAKIVTVRSPNPQEGFGLTYDASRQRTVMFGGVRGSPNETWEYDGKTWTQMTPMKSPSGRYDFDFMVYDSGRKRCVLFGGRLVPNYNSKSAETWEYKGRDSFRGTPSTISVATGGAQAWLLDAGSANRGRLYWVMGSLSGTFPGVTLASGVGSVTMPLNPDYWTQATLALANTPALTNSRGVLDSAGQAQATLNVPAITNPSAIGVALDHAYLVFDARSNYYLASNAVTLGLVK